MPDEVERICVSVVSDSLRPMDCSPPGSSVHGIFQARILEWVAVPSSGGIFLTQGLNLCQFFTTGVTREGPLTHIGTAMRKTM